MNTEEIWSDDYLSNVEDDEDATYVLTPHCILYETLKGFGIQIGQWYPSLWEHIFEDFMEKLVDVGYVNKKEGD